MTNQNSARKKLISLLLIGILLYTIIWPSFYLMAQFTLFDWLNHYKPAINSIGLSILVIVFSYWFYANSATDLLSTKSIEKYQKSNLGADINQQIFDELYSYISKPEFYCNSEAKLATLSEISGYSAHQISQALNQQESNSFNRLVNKLRVEHIKKLLAEPANRHTDIMTQAYEAGFNSKATFNRVFKQFEGKTPKQYRQEQQEL